MTDNRVDATLSDVMPNAWRLFSKRSFGESKLLPTRAVPGRVVQLVLWVIDGLGYDQLTTALASGLMPHLARALTRSENRLYAIQTVSPSVTPVALASLVTGTAPAVHGILGQVLYADGGVIDILRGPLPETFGLAAAPAGAVCRALDVPYRVVLEHRLRTGPLTHVLHREVEEIHTYIRDSGLSVLVNDLLSRVPRGLFYVYSSGIDSINHERGAYSDEWRAEMAMLDHHLSAIEPSDGGQVILWITADHGHRPIAGVIPYDQLQAEIPQLPRRVARVGPAISVDVEDVVRCNRILKTLTPAAVEIVKTDDVIARGYFGQPTLGHLRARLGDYLLIPEPGWTWVDQLGEAGGLWGHGGATAAEMQIPWLEIFIPPGGLARG
ncbi:MAG: alkaline phosphatase family protein [Firmicutes bacterium]|nr:alkaline phosphatase family protein [Bacillota bacterium]